MKSIIACFYRLKRTCCLNVDDAIYNNHIRCMRKFHRAGEPLSHYTTLLAAANNRLGCLDYAHKNACPFHTDCIYVAAYRCNLECLVYLCQNGAPMPFAHYTSLDSECLAFLWNYRGHCIEFDTRSRTELKCMVQEWMRSIDILQKEWHFVPKDIFTVVLYYCQ
jgi:hypothetical protein